MPLPVNGWWYGQRVARFRMGDLRSRIVFSLEQKSHFRQNNLFH